MTTVAIAGLVIGRMIDQKIRKMPAPSITPDSSKSLGNPRMKPSRIIIVKDRWNAVYGKINDKCVSSRCNFCMIRKIGIKVA
ncbi:hypothetical protein D3C81_1271200 [compost metagenome]